MNCLEKIINFRFTTFIESERQRASAELISNYFNSELKSKFSVTDFYHKSNISFFVSEKDYFINNLKRKNERIYARSGYIAHHANGMFYFDFIIHKSVMIDNNLTI